MDGAHPGLKDGIVTRDVCKSNHRGCCSEKLPPIQVKACPGNFYVYKLYPPKACNSVFCTDANTISKDVPVRAPCHNLNCTADEVCGETRGISGCMCKDDHHRVNAASFGSVITCHNSSAWISLSRCLLSEAGFSTEVLHLNNSDCKGTVRDGRVEFHFNNDDRKCGTQLKVNGTHAIYENSIQGKVDSADGLIISRERTLNLQFACVYPLTQNTSMGVAVDVLKSITQLTLPPGKGTYQIRMIPYKDADFTELFDGAVAQTSDEEIYISVDVEGVDSRQFSSVLDLCWATPTNNSTSSITWSLITKQCANPEDGTVEVLRNGESTSSRFSFRMFTFNGHPPQLYLHCSLHLCLLEGNSCAPTCKSSHLKRLRRSSDLNDTSATMVSFGPLIFPSGKTDLLDVRAPQPKRYRPKV
ncbi:pancreatic secretory granule membrane major glycoprotein GP2-like [Engraulis encrasicolus]|uniref:pancreatic secretory granule membrane major glycoprotein GP2-like n=1 Tax=Engraulis encrasicolus TaxID=184585 RepID=UPI002FD0A2D5